MYEIIPVFKQPNDVAWVAHGNGIRLATCGKDSRIYMRVAMKAGAGETARWLVGKVIAGLDKDGQQLPVYLYAERDSADILRLVMTTEDMSP